MERGDLLTENAKIFKEQGAAIDKYAKKTIKVLVVGNPANTNALIAATFAPSIPRKNFTALTRLDQNRAISQVSDKVGCRVEDVKNIIIWGNHSATQYPDVTHGVINVEGNKPKPIREVVKDDTWIEGDFISKV
jgi:malate dehydrogenase